MTVLDNNIKPNSVIFGGKAVVKKVDFHIHTISSEKDYDFSYSTQWLEDYVQKSELDAIAITNHDLFDKDNFEKVKQDIPSSTTVFPGIELSLESGHVNIIFSEEDMSNLVEFSSWLATKSLGEKGKITTEDLCENMSNWENGIYIFELGKSNSLSVPEKLSGVCAVAGVTNQLKFQSFYKMKGGLTPVLFSDAHADENDPEEKRKNIDILKRKNTFLQVDNCSFQEIKNCITDKSKVGINADHLSGVIDIGKHTVSTGLNLIVGKRGTGKTNFLEKIKRQYDFEDIYEIAQFETSKSDEFIEKQRKEQGQNSVNDWKKQYNSQFSAIQNYLNNPEDDFDRKLENYISSVKKFAKDMAESNSKSKYKLSKESNFEELSTENLERYLLILYDIINNSDFWILLKNSTEKKKVFVETYNELRELYVKKRERNDIQEKVNEILVSVKRIVQSKTGITPVFDCEFSKIVQKSQTEKEINKFMDEIICETVLKRDKIHGYQIIVKLSPFKNADQFRKDFTTREGVHDDLIVPYRNVEYIKFLKNLKKKKFFKYSNIPDYFLHLEVQLLDAEGTPASGGQAVGFALMMRLEEAKTKPIVLIDEPEASLDNAYIREELIKAIRDLSTNSTVFVVTHNSTLGALLEPDYLIVTAKNDEKNYHILTGEFSSHFVSNSSDILENSYEKFVEAMEAGIETYNKKGEIYESLRNK